MVKECGEINMEAMKMGARPEQKSITTEAARLAEEHWEYVEGLLKTAGITDPTCRLTVKLVKYHYTTAFIHGWKHAMRSSNITNKVVMPKAEILLEEIFAT